MKALFLFSLFRNNSWAETVLFGVFGLIILVFLVVDLGFLNSKAHKISTKSALLQSLFWVGISSIFGYLVFYFYQDGETSSLDASIQYFSAYLTEYALSVDNIFVILLILKDFAIKEEYYHKILFWGILGTVVLRGIFIFVGAYVIAKWHFVLYLFGAILVYSGIKTYLQESDKKIDPEKNPILRLCKKYLQITPDEMGGQFFVKNAGKLMFTPLFLVVILVETTDLIFAADSIPAAFAITQDEFLIYTSNIFAVMGLRAMFFLLAGIIDRFYLLQKGLSIILFFIGTKMLIESKYKFAPILSFTVIFATITLSIVFSILVPRKEEVHESSIK